MKESEEKLHQYQSAAGELEGQCQDQAAEISDLQAQLDGALADEDQASLSLVVLYYDHVPQVVESGNSLTIFQLMRNGKVLKRIWPS